MHGATDLHDDLGHSGIRIPEPSPPIPQLTPTQMEVLRCVRCGLLNKQIAWQLKISEKTVKMHRALMLQRLRKRRPEAR